MSERSQERTRLANEIAKRSIVTKALARFIEQMADALKPEVTQFEIDNVCAKLADITERPIAEVPMSERNATLGEAIRLIRKLS
jgi:hypothetical protein